MNPFIKAGIYTILIVALALLIVAQLDASRAGALRQSIDTAMFQNQERQVIEHYSQVLANDTSSECRYLARLRQKEFDETYPLAQRVQDYEKSNLLNQEYLNIKTGYFLGMMEIYLSGFENRKMCANEEVPLVLFYTEKTNCPECRTQNNLLPFIASRCPGVRIYAFPSDSDLTPLQMLTDRYSITRTPALVINDRVQMVGLQDENAIMTALNAQGAHCSINANVPASKNTSNGANAGG